MNMIGEQRAWTAEEDDAICAAERPVNDVLALQLGRKVNAIDTRRWKLMRRGRVIPNYHPILKAREHGAEPPIQIKHLPKPVTDLSGLLTMTPFVPR